MAVVYSFSGINGMGYDQSAELMGGKVGAKVKARMAALKKKLGPKWDKLPKWKKALLLAAAPLALPALLATAGAAPALAPIAKTAAKVALIRKGVKRLAQKRAAKIKAAKVFGLPVSAIAAAPFPSIVSELSAPSAGLMTASAERPADSEGPEGLTEEGAPEQAPQKKGSALAWLAPLAVVPFLLGEL